MRAPHFIRLINSCLILIALSCGHLFAQSDSAANSFFEEGIRRYYTGEYRLAIDCLRRALEQKASLTRAYDYLGLCAARLGDCEQADQLFLEALARDSSNLDRLGQAAQVMLDCGLLGRSQAYFSRILRIAPNHLGSIFGLSQIYSQQGDFEKGIDYLKQGLTVDPDNLQLHYRLGSMYLASRKPELAVSYLWTVLEANPKHFAALRDLGTAYLQLDSLAEAAVLLQQALNIEPGNANISLSMANCDYRRKRYAEALLLYHKLEREPFVPNVYLQEGLCYFYLDKFDSAIINFRLALRIDSTNAGAHFNYALSLAEQHKYRDAISEFNKAIKYSKDEIVTSSYDRIGTAYYQMRRKGLALEAFRRAIAEDSLNARAYYDMGVLYETLYKDRQNAIRCYRKVVYLGGRRQGMKSLAEIAEKRMKYLISIK